MTIKISRYMMCVQTSFEHILTHDLHEVFFTETGLGAFYSLINLTHILIDKQPQSRPAGDTLSLTIAIL